MASIRHKRGDTFDWLLLMPETDFADGYFIGWTVAAQLRKATGRLISELITTWADPEEETRVLRLFADQTKGWPVGVHEIDVQFTRASDGLIRSTETISAEIVKDVTILS